MNRSIENDPLWTRIRNMDIDGVDLALPFSQRLARDNGWDPQYADRVILEYKRFIYLAVTQGKPVTPSDQIDQAWHLHLAYSRHYWSELCDEILGEPLHHNPTEGGKTEKAKFKEWYTKTLEIYERVFGIKPSADIWPPPKDRFLHVDNFRRVNSANCLILETEIYGWVFLLTGVMILVFALVLRDVFAALLAIGLIGVSIYMAAKSSNDKSSSERGGGCGGCGGCGG